MGRASRTKQSPSRQQKIAALRAAERRRQVRNRLLLSGGAVVVVIAVVVGFIVAASGRSSGSGTQASNGPTGAALATIVSEVTNVPTSTLNTVGAGPVTTGLHAVSGAALTSGGKPEMLYIGAEYCPYCAAERWAMIVALSRFGTFTGLRTIHSSSSDVYANTPTWTFYGSHYTSKYLTFTPVEETTNVEKNGTYPTLQTPTAAQQALLTKYDTAGSIPFIDIGNRYVQIGNSNGYGPQTLQGKTWSQIAAALKNPSNPVAQAIDGEANYLTAAICKLTGNQPASACTSTVKALESKI